LTFPFLNIFHELFYPNGYIVIPANIFDYFTVISLAFLIMDDGLKAGGGLRLCTDSYQYSDILILVEMIQTKYYIYCYPQMQSHGEYLYLNHKWKRIGQRLYSL
jgi:hypothetical protein